MAEYTGVKRSHALMVQDEEVSGFYHSTVVKFRFDIQCKFWENLLTKYPQLFLPPLLPQEEDEEQQEEQTKPREPMFLGSARGGGQQKSPFDWGDFAWVSTREVADTSFSVVDEYHKGCGWMQTKPGKFEEACASIATSAGVEQFNWHGSVTTGKLYECIVNIRMRAQHPTAVFLDPAIAKWTCFKRTKHHEYLPPHHRRSLRNASLRLKR